MAYMVLSYEEVGPSNVTVSSGGVTAFTVPGNNGYVGTLTSADETPISGAPNGYTFYDDYAFSIPTGASADSITSTINLGNVFNINDLNVRIYEYINSNGQQVNSPLTLGNPNGTVYDGTMQNGSDVVDAMLDPGTYILEVRGVVTGSSGGTYAGTLQVAPVPLPAALPLLLSGLGLLGGLARSRSRVSAT